MSFQSLAHSCTALSMAFIIAMTANSTAHANAIPTQTSEIHSSDQNTRLKAENFVEMMESLPEDATPEEAAPIIFPNNREAQVEFVSNFQKLDDDYTDTNFRALPALLAPFGVALAKCAVGALGGAAVNEIISEVRHGNRASADARVDAAIGGCITAVVPPFLRSTAERAKVPIRNAVIALIIRWNT